MIEDSDVDAAYHADYEACYQACKELEAEGFWEDVKRRYGIKSSVDPSKNPGKSSSEISSGSVVSKKSLDGDLEIR
jgi:hypothetical protein